jgi:hypothetical protein
MCANLKRQHLEALALDNFGAAPEVAFLPEATKL